MSQEEIGRMLGKSQSWVTFWSRVLGVKWSSGFANPRRDQNENKNSSYIDGLSRSTIRRITKKIVLQSGRSLTVCEKCGIDYDKNLPRHHKDRNRANNTLSNIEVICTSCHSKEHITERIRDEKGRLISTGLALARDNRLRLPLNPIDLGDLV